jgi:hypothetical protein
MATSRKDRPKGLPKQFDQRVNVSTAVEYTQRYRRSAPASEHAGFFFSKGITALLAQPGVFGMRIYHGLDKNGRYRMVLVGVDEKGEDIVKAAPKRGTAKSRAAGDALLLDTHVPCPPFCSSGSPLA